MTLMKHILPTMNTEGNMSAMYLGNCGFPVSTHHLLTASKPYRCT
jgi:hypothetical protein